MGYFRAVLLSRYLVANTPSADVTRDQNIAAALRHVARGIAALARVFAEPEATPEPARYLAALQEWGTRGLTRKEASQLLRKHGFAPQASGGWSRGDWIELRKDGLRYLTALSTRWIKEQAKAND